MNKVTTKNNPAATVYYIHNTQSNYKNNPGASED